MQSKEATLRKKNEEMDHLKKNLKQKEIQLTSISAKVNTGAGDCQLLALYSFENVFVASLLDRIRVYHNT